MKRRGPELESGGVGGEGSRVRSCLTLYNVIRYYRWRLGEGVVAVSLFSISSCTYSCTCSASSWFSDGSRISSTICEDVDVCAGV